jgi:hypothetical protein
VRSTGAQRGSLDQVALLTADHSASERAVVLGDAVVAGTMNAASAVVVEGAADVTASLAGGESQPYAISTGQAVAVTLGAGGTSRVLVLRADRTRGSGAADATGILVRVPDGQGWRTVAHLYPRREFADLAADVGAATQVRLEFLSAARLAFAGELIRSPEDPTLTWASLQSAAKGSQSDLTATIGSSDGSSVSLAAGDTLRLAFAVPALESGKAREVFLAVQGALESGMVSGLAQAETPATDALPAQFTLYSARPNPFTQRTAIRFGLPVASQVRLEVFDIQGRRVRVLQDGVLPAGYHSVDWDSRDGSGAKVSPGTYFYRLRAGSFEARRKKTLAR